MTSFPGASAAYFIGVCNFELHKVRPLYICGFRFMDARSRGREALHAGTRQAAIKQIAEMKLNQSRYVCRRDKPSALCEDGALKRILGVFVATVRLEINGRAYQGSESVRLHGAFFLMRLVRRLRRGTRQSSMFKADAPLTLQPVFLCTPFVAFSLPFTCGVGNAPVFCRRILNSSFSCPRFREFPYSNSSGHADHLEAEESDWLHRCTEVGAGVCGECSQEP